MLMLFSILLTQLCFVFCAMTQSLSQYSASKKFFKELLQKLGEQCVLCGLQLHRKIAVQKYGSLLNLFNVNSSKWQQL